ncbi:MAG: acyl-CoA dehydrogenase family protein [Candidatus Baldrarchaeia archaeon]
MLLSPFGPELEKFREEVISFLERELVPLVDKIERENYFAREFIEACGREGYLGSLFPKEYGGTERGAVAEVIIAEETAAICPAMEMSRASSCVLFAFPVFKFGTEEQRREYLAPVIKGEKLGALGITEPGAGSDITMIATTAEKKGNEWVINGEKRFITNGSVADFILVYAKIKGGPEDPRKALTAFIVETEWSGFEVVKDFELMGMRGVRNSHLRFKDLRVPKENVLGGVGNGYQVMMAGLDVERTIIAAGCIGYAVGAFEQAVRYSMERVQFDRPIRKFEAISFRIADMATKILAARLLVMHAARAVDEGRRATLEAAIAKVFASEMACEVCDDALQILGGIGYTKEMPVEKFYRDARLMKIGAGTSEIQRFIIQREIYKIYDQMGKEKKRII